LPESPFGDLDQGGYREIEAAMAARSPLKKSGDKTKQSSQKHALGLDPGVAFPVLRKNTERTFIVSGKRSLCENKGI
jgi:hypothetical protein